MENFLFILSLCMAGVASIYRQEHIKYVLNKTQGNVIEAARMLQERPICIG